MKIIAYRLSAIVFCSALGACATATETDPLNARVDGLESAQEGLERAQKDNANKINCLNSVLSGEFNNDISIVEARTFADEYQACLDEFSDAS
ncbi:MAG: hypothetical protein AAGB02_07015 [Pseudomonadota bacterium]